MEVSEFTVIPFTCPEPSVPPSDLAVAERLKPEPVPVGVIMHDEAADWSFWMLEIMEQSLAMENHEGELASETTILLSAFPVFVTDTETVAWLFSVSVFPPGKEGVTVRAANAGEPNPNNTASTATKSFILILTP